MLSHARIRELLRGRAERLSDADLNQLAEGLYMLARHAVGAYPSKGLHSDSESEESALAVLPADEREAVEERAAVLEFDGKMSRDTATRTALSVYVLNGRTRRETDL